MLKDSRGYDEKHEKLRRVHRAKRLMMQRKTVMKGIIGKVNFLCELYFYSFGRIIYVKIIK